MGIFDFFKKIFEEDRAVENVKEKITFSDIGNWVEKKGKENEIKEKEILSLINNKINLFVKKIEEKINALKSIDIESKKAEDKIKSITNEGRKKYLESLDIFIGNLEKLKENNLEKSVEEMNWIFLSFNKNSRMSYERATILVGKEMENIKETMRIFSKEIIRIFDENKNVVDSHKIVSIVKQKLNKINEIEIEIGSVNETLVELDKKISNKKEENKKLIEEIEEIKKSPDYLKNLEKQERNKFLKEELKKEIFNLKQLIDFKSLSSFFHIFEEEMKIVKLHREDFPTNFKKDYGKSILKLLNEAKLNNEQINSKVKEIKSKEEEIEKNKSKIMDYETQEPYSEITNGILEVGNLDNEKSREEKRMEKIKLSKEEMIEEVKENIEKIGGVI
ncbi:MAG: hypothetical protein WC584_04420 [Candidatus Pacearchaeota archaeon]